MGMQMDHGMEMDPEQAIAQLQVEQVEIRRDLDKCLKFITGNGDPTKGLLWLAADLGRLVASQSALLEAQRVALETHKLEGHYVRNSWTRMGYDVGKSVAVWASVGFLAFAVAHVHLSIGAPLP